MTVRLEISIGPVQGFVAQSRRTRDLWGSSFLLSFLSAHAMLGAREAGGRIVRPVVDDDPLLRWIAGSREGAAPRIGSVPNHFVVELERDASSVAQASIASLEAAWKRIHAAVWARFVEHARSAGEGTEATWNRQVNGFWEVMWAACKATGSPGLFTRRKHWRTHRLSDEPGDKCTVMHDLQELSGFVRAENRTRRQQQDAFWAKVRERTGLLDLRDDERLCAIALVKRLFPKVAREALGWQVDTSHWPSTEYVAAAPWTQRVTRFAGDQARDYAEAVLRHAPPGALSARQPLIVGLDHDRGGNFQRLDARYIHRSLLEDERLCPLEGASAEARADLVRRLQDLESVTPKQGARALGPPPTFYALLLGDGDRLGRLVAHLGAHRVSEALSRFTAGVPDIVGEHQGVTVYAGGDDVLAMLPVSSALRCASALSEGYRTAFERHELAAEATLSAAIVFAHVRLPLGAVLGEARRLLDDVAKDGNGRDSLAAGVLKRGGLHCQWVTTWRRPQPGGASVRATDLLAKLAARLQQPATVPSVSSGLLYRIRATLSLLCGWPRWGPGSWGDLPANLDVRAFLRAEILRSLIDTAAATGEDADELADLLVTLLGPARARNGVAERARSAEAGVDAFLLARFLADPTFEEAQG